MNNLKAKREAAGMSQSQLAEASGINVRIIQHYEQDYRDINKAQAITAIKLADALGCGVKEIMND